MKGMKKLFALLAVLTMALTLTPMVTPLNAATFNDITVTPNPTSATLLLNVNPTALITVAASLSGGDITNQEGVTYSWSSGNTGVATVVGTGSKAEVTAVAYGKTNIQVVVRYTLDGDEHVGTALIPVTVQGYYVEFEGLDNGKLSLYTATPNNERAVTANIIFNDGSATSATTTDPNNTDDKWSVQPADLVTFSATGSQTTTITAGSTRGNGVVTFSATVNGAPVKGSFDVAVQDHILSISVVNSPTMMLKNDTTLLTATANLDNESLPTDASITYTWSSSDSNVVEIASTGSIVTATAKGIGTAQITVTATCEWDTQTATAQTSFTIRVEEPTLDVDIEGAPEITIAAGTSTELIANVTINTGDTITYSWTNSNPNAVIVDSIDNNKILIRGANVTQEDYSIITVTAKAGSLTKTATIKVIVTPAAAPITGVILANANGQWVTVGSDRLYQVSYDVYNAPTNAQGLVVQLTYGNTLLGESALNFRQVSARFENIWRALGGKDGVLKLVLLNSTASTTVPVSFLKLDSTFKDSYISGEHSGAVTGTITAQKSGFVIGRPNSTMELGLVAQWEDAEGEAHTLKLKTVTATVGPDGKFAEFALPANIDHDVYFNVPAGNVYVVSKNVYDDMADGKYNGIPVAKFAYKTIAIKQGTLTANPNTIVLPPFTKEIYLYDQFGYALQNTTVKVDFGYKVSATANAPSITATTDAYGKVVLRDIPKPVNYGTYTATISTLVGSRAVVDGVAKINVSFASQLVLSDNIIHTPSIHQLGEISIKVNSSGAPIKKLKIDVSDPNNVLAPYDDPNDELDDFKLLAKSPFSYKWDFVSSTPCEKKLVDEYWFADPAQEEVTLTGTAVQGGTIMITATAELADGSIAVASKEYVVKAYRIDSITPVSTEYNTSTTVKVVIKDWYGGLADGLNVKLVSDNPYGQVGQSQFTMIPNNFGSYVFNIPAGAVPGDYAVVIDGVDYSEWSGAYFSVTPIPDLKVTAPASANAMARFDVTVTDKSGNLVNGTWSIKKQVSGSLVNGKFTVDTAAFKDGSSLGDYTVTVISSDGKHSGSAVVSIVAPATITPTIVTNGFKSNVVVTMTSTALNASLLDIAQKFSAPDSVVSEKVYNAQTATFTIKVLKSGMCTTVPELTLKYGKFVLDNGALTVGHPQLSFVNTATLYAGDIVPMQVKLVDAVGNPLAGAIIKLSQLGYFSLTATTSSTGIADFGNVTISVPGNIVAELISNADLNNVVDFRLIGQTDNTTTKQ